MSRDRRRRRYRDRRRRRRWRPFVDAPRPITPIMWLAITHQGEVVRVPVLVPPPPYSLYLQRSALEALFPPTQGLHTPLTAPSSAVALRVQAAALSRYLPRG